MVVGLAPRRVPLHAGDLLIGKCPGTKSAGFLLSTLIKLHCRPLTRSQEEQKILARAATVHAHPKDSLAVEQLFASSGWSTLLMLVESSASIRSPPPANPPSAAFDAMGIDSPTPASRQPAPSAQAAQSGERVCPHCTFVNEGGRSDCEICGLPLDG